MSGCVVYEDRDCWYGLRIEEHRLSDAGEWLHPDECDGDIEAARIAAQKASTSGSGNA